MLARRGRVSGGRSLLHRFATDFLSPSTVSSGAVRSLSFVRVSVSPSPWSSFSPRLQPFNARFLSQGLHDPDYQEDEAQEIQDRDEPPRDTRLMSLEKLENEYITRLTATRESTDGDAAWNTALDIFEEIQRSQGRGLSLGVASFLVETLGARKRPEDCLKVLAYARTQGIRPRIQAYSSAIGCCYKREEYGHALRVFEVMRNDGYVPQAVTYSHALSSGLKAEKHELVLEIFDDMIRNRVDMGIVIYNNILNSCARAADIQSALGVLRAIRQQDLVMTQASYHSLAICAGKTGRWELALEALDTMQKAGFAPTPTIYNSVFSACAKGKQWETVVEVYESMPRELQDQLRGIYLGAVVMGHAKSEDEAVRLHALEIFDQYKARTTEEQPNFFAHNAALTALLETNQLEEVHKLANKMKQQGMQWDTLTFQCVILAYIRGGAIETAVQMLNRENKRYDKTAVCYRELIKFYDENRKNPREAVRLMMQMMQMNKRLSRLDWINALRISLQLPERTPYWNFRKWMNIRAKSIINDMPENLMLPSHADVKRVLRQGEEAQQKDQANKHRQDDYFSRKRRLNRRKSQHDHEKLL